ncbi:unnamed protein product [Pieris macdunnoughi]|uniref:DNA-3-methyladenine glycosylase I n=1 Tax=Pieris macdunnoughi TaxID=345717 RepID=A0A821N9L2_9NEOP|nr:unnamed protein product [Pieris macdunnoughi]
MKRCGWVNNDPLYISYHDNEWGVPELHSQKLFELLCLEGQQAGLSWITILKKRESYRQLFHNFDPYEIEKFDDNCVQIFLSETRIVRHKGKIQAIINNAKCYIDMESNEENFSDFIWKFVHYKPIINNWTSDKEVPTETEVSKELSKSLKQRGFKFVGSTICYAFMQASGLVNDHITDCVCRKKI